jgi:hypothetical protein
MTDSLAYLHGTGTQAGPLTSTANVAGSGSQAGTILTITTVTSGQFGVGQYISGTGLPAGEYITALGSGSGTAGTYAVSATSTTAAAFTTVTATPNTLGDAIGTASGYTNLEIDFGAPNSGAAFPNIVQFPSLTEKGYTFAPEIVGQGGVDMGIHVIVTGYVNNLTSLKFDVCTSATTNALVGSSPNPIASRTLTLAQLEVVGAHYYIPVQGSAVLEFLRVYMTLTGTAATAGTAAIWYGPRTGGEQ